MQATNYEKTPGGVLLPNPKIAIGGVFHGQLFRKGKLIDEWEDPNLVTDEGLTHMLDVHFHGATQIGTWYIGLFEGNYTPVSTVTAATITAAATESTAYAETTRQAYVEAAAAAKSITNSANRALFTINATKTMYGAFLASASAKSATTGVLFAASKFATPKAVEALDELLLTYTINGSSI